MNEIEIHPEMIRMLARIAGFKIPEEDIPYVVVLLQDHLRAMALLDTVDATDAEPDTHFDPRWYE